ncbi:MAG TPA: hypothetical protein VME23_01805 [Terracidiphilus sp.]|nr:hypothetical protein [Terracidiphilus sp.]
MSRKQRVAKNARRITIFLTPADELALHVIETRRRQRREERDSPSEVVSDALWKFLETTEGVPRDKVDSLLPLAIQATPASNIKKFPKQ